MTGEAMVGSVELTDLELRYTRSQPGHLLRALR